DLLGGEGVEVGAAAGLEVVDGAHQPDRSLLDQVAEGQASFNPSRSQPADHGQLGLEQGVAGRLVARARAPEQVGLLAGARPGPAAPPWDLSGVAVGGAWKGRAYTRAMPGRRLWLLAFALLAVLPGPASASSPEVVRADLDGEINSITASYLEGVVDRAAGERA